jgi:hypothetical protein
MRFGRLLLLNAFFRLLNLLLLRLPLKLGKIASSKAFSRLLKVTLLRIIGDSGKLKDNEWKCCMASASVWGW